MEHMSMKAIMQGEEKYSQMSNEQMCVCKTLEIISFMWNVI